ncbi:MAG: cation diffusion facilitator family transporter [Clostridiales bacterium]|nr:cation diffusion facilitator family transporter [Clostridiales bacterium]
MERDTIINASENTIIKRISAESILGNVLLSAIKLLAGIFAHSSAMVSDAIHSMSDVFTTLIALVGVRISKKSADKSHPYGHERFECVASLLLGLLLLATGLGIGYSGIKTIAAGHYDTLAVPGVPALAAAIISIITKEAMFHYTRHYARILNSSAFMADAWHHRSDALSSIGSLIGISGAMMGFPVLDPVASVVICIFILKVGCEIIADALRKMLDTPCSDAYEKEISDFIAGYNGVTHLDLLHTRMFGDKIYIDCEIAVDGDLPLRDAHAIAESIHDGVEQRYDNVKHIMIHVNPS